MVDAKPIWANIARRHGLVEPTAHESVPVDPDFALSPKPMRCIMKQPGTAQDVQS
jgi:hypothetical protein